jgi:hypothetical protein
MPDWKSLVRQRLESAELPAASREEVIQELTTHMEEEYETARSRGLADAAAIEHALQEVREVDDWRVLAADIRRAKSEEDPMNARTKSLWLPGLVTLAGASGCLMLIQFAGLRPRPVRIGGVAMQLYWPWLATLPVFGALGAYLSQRAHGPIRTRLAVGISPALVMLAMMSLILPWGLAIDGFSFLRIVYFGIGLANWVAIPGLALLVGAIPFLREPSLQRA